MTTFLLDLRRLDSSAEVLEAKIEAEALACFKRNGIPHYAFYQVEVDLEDMPISLLRPNHAKDIFDSELHFRYKLANVLFLPFSDAPLFQNGSTLGAWERELNGKVEGLYVEGKFLQGDAMEFKKYGIAFKL